MSILWQHGDRHDPHLGARIVQAVTGHGSTVVWISTSGTILCLGPGTHFDLVRVRVHAGTNPHLGDDLAVAAPGFDATSCGCWDDTQYRSTPPLLVAAATAQDIPRLHKHARQLGTNWTPTPPAGHPDAACGAHICLAGHPSNPPPG